MILKVFNLYLNKLKTLQILRKDRKYLQLTKKYEF
jgi:hypothetical protein